jgi:hypothetical protein
MRWARESSNFTKEIVIEHFGQSSKKSFSLDGTLLDQMETSPTPIKLGLLKELASFYKRPLAVFFLEAAPQREKKLADFRTRLNRHTALSASTMLVVRSAWKAQAVGRELSEELGEKLLFSLGSYDTNMSPEKVAAQFREKIGFSEERQARFHTPDELFSWLRSKIEEMGALVLKEPFPVDDALAFSLTDDQPFTIVINSKWGGLAAFPPNTCDGAPSAILRSEDRLHRATSRPRPSRSPCGALPNNNSLLLHRSERHRMRRRRFRAAVQRESRNATLRENALDAVDLASLSGGRRITSSHRARIV